MSDPTNVTAEAADHQRFSDIIARIEERAAWGPVTLEELFTICGPRGQGFVAVFLILPFLQPIPLPGLSSAIGLVLALIGLFVALRRPPWLPRRLARVSVEPATVLRISTRLRKLLGAVEHVVRPRAAWLFSHRWFRATNGILWIVHAILFSLPFPIPLSNSFPAVVVLLLALGTLEEDFALIALGYLGAVANVLFFGGLLALPALGFWAYGH